MLIFGKSGFIGQDEAGHGRSTVGLTRARDTTIILGPPDPYGLVDLVQTVYACYFTVHTSDWLLPEAPLPLTLGPQDLSAVLRPLEATSWADVPLAEDELFSLLSNDASCRIPHLTPCLNSRSFPGSQAQRPITAFGATATLVQIAHLPGTAPISMVPSSESATRRPRFGSDSTCIALADALNWCSKCLESGRSRLLLKSHLHYVSRMILHRLECFRC